MSKLIQQLKKARSNSGKTLREVAAETGLQATQISHIETEKVTPNLSTLEKLAECYDKEIVLIDR